MPSKPRVADDFDAIRQRMKELSSSPEIDIDYENDKNSMKWIYRARSARAVKVFGDKIEYTTAMSPDKFREQHDFMKDWIFVEKT